MKATSSPRAVASASIAIAVAVRPEERRPTSSESCPRGTPPPSARSRPVWPVGARRSAGTRFGDSAVVRVVSSFFDRSSVSSSARAVDAAMTFALFSLSQAMMSRGSAPCSTCTLHPAPCTLHPATLPPRVFPSGPAWTFDGISSSARTRPGRQPSGFQSLERTGFRLIRQAPRLLMSGAGSLDRASVLGSPRGHQPMLGNAIRAALSSLSELRRAPRQGDASERARHFKCEVQTAKC